MDIAEFLLARIAEDEAVARQVEIGVEAAYYSVIPGYRPHLVRWLPDRVLAECEAKRRIVEQYREAIGYYEARPMVDAGEVTGLEFAVKMLSTPYADHPDYDPAWSLVSV